MKDEDPPAPDTEKAKQLREDTGSPEKPLMTTNQGTPIADNQNSLKAGVRGPALMEDFIFREKMTHFDHERIPERVVHARGSGAHGYFQVYEPLTDLTKAAVFADPSVKTPVFVRFSTVVGSRGSADTVRDVRGFATKFYTSEGVWDLVGNNIPVFFIQDAMKFPDLVHAIKPEPNNEMPQASAAHDNFWDFVSLTPESIHMIMWVLSDRGLPRSYAMMEGFGVHTFRFVNDAGKSRFVKFHWKPVLGAHSLVWDEVQKLAGKDPDFNRRDLWERIEMGSYPEFELGVQIVEEENEHDFDFDLLDATKFIPEELVPVRRIGKMTLNRNPDNFFAETEQVAFHPGHVVPGIDFTNDPLLQGRLFSYLDTQLNRFGSANFHEVPINRTIAPVRNNQTAGFMRREIGKGRVNYEPSSLGRCPMHNPENLRAFMSYPEQMEGRKVRERSETFSDHFTQATLFRQSQSDAEKDHLVSAGKFELGKVETMHVRQRMIDLLANVDREMAERIAAGVGITKVTGDISYLAESTSPQPSAKRGAAAPGRSAALSMDQPPSGSVKTRKVAIVAADGFDGKSVAELQLALTKESAMSHIVSTKLGPVKAGTGGDVEADKTFLTAGSIMYDAVYIAGGRGSIETLTSEGDALHFVNEAFRHCKTIGATGEGVDLVSAAQLKGTVLAGSDSGGQILSHGGIVTAREGFKVDAFIRDFVDAIAHHRHWGREKKEQVPA